MTTPLVSTAWLAEHLRAPDLRTVDVRWYLLDKSKDGRTEYERGHIPGAVWIDVDRDLAASVGRGPGRHPLPTAEQFQQAMRRAGINSNTHVVAYDDNGGANAARLWWLLRYFGHLRVSLLDGGIVRWIAEGRPLASGTETAEPGDWTAGPGRPEWVVNREQVEALARSPRALVMDARAPERYRGEVEPIDPRAGHVPGAKSAPYAQNWRSADDPSLREAEELRARFEELGASEDAPIVSYCGSGINACLNILALHVAGFEGNVLLYEGSWSDWSRDESRPAATGDKP